MNTSFNRDSVKAGTGRRFLGGILDENSLCYTLEVSFFCYTPASSSTVVPYDEDSCILYFTPTQILVEAILFIHLLPSMAIRVQVYDFCCSQQIIYLFIYL